MGPRWVFGIVPLALQGNVIPRMCPMRGGTLPAHVNAACANNTGGGAATALRARYRARHTLCARHLPCDAALTERAQRLRVMCMM